MTPEEGNEVREIIWEMSRVTNKILLLGILLILAILITLRYHGILFMQPNGGSHLFTTLSRIAARQMHAMV